MEPRPRTYLTELVGTFLFVFVSAGTVCATYLPADHRPEATPVALAEGFALAVVLTVTAFVSIGFLNPAITLTLWVFRRLTGGQAAGLIVTQLLGSFLAGLLIRVLFAPAVLRDARVGAPHLRALLGPEESVLFGSLLSGLGVEILLTFLLTLAVFATYLDPRGPRVGGILVGLAQAAVVLFGFHLTGGSANPARWFGPALWELTVHPAPTAHPLADNPVYWVAPVFGALLAALFYSALILPRGEALPPRAKERGPAK